MVFTSSSLETPIFLNFIYVFILWPHGVWGLSSLNSDQTLLEALEVLILKQWTAKEVPGKHQS